MADSIIKKLKGLFMSNREKDESVSDSSQAPDIGGVVGGLDAKDTPEDDTPVEATVPPDETSEKTEDIEEIEQESEVKAEKTHEKVSRVAKEMNTKGYGV